MKPIKDRYEELKSYSKIMINSNYGELKSYDKIMINSNYGYTSMINPTSDNYYLKIILNTINKEYFNNTLNIKLDKYNLIINNEIRNNTQNLIEYLQSLHDLESLKRKIERIYETN